MYNAYFTSGQCQAGGSLMGWPARARKVYTQPKRHNLHDFFFSILHLNGSCLSVFSSGSWMNSLLFANWTLAPFVLWKYDKGGFVFSLPTPPELSHFIPLTTLAPDSLWWLQLNLSYRRLWWCCGGEGDQRRVQNMEEKYTIPVWPCYDTCSGVAKSYCAVAPWCHTVSCFIYSRLS